ncbi:MAG TPA: (Fe-S)-binding protein [Pseudogracilibacillus sp.]|nr:(Fe-S)-binding protein [Pseudogracilibacillus sp.]
MKVAEVKQLREAFIEKLDYDELMNCTRCGFCLPSCPTYFETGQNEVHSPRGRIALMKSVVDGIMEPSDELKRSIDVCLGCRACEPVCPSGVKFGKLLEQSRDAIYQTIKQPLHVRIVRNITFSKLFPHKDRMRHVTNFIGIYQRSGLQKIVRKTKATSLLPKQLNEMEKVLPNIPTNKKLKNRPHVLPNQTKETYRVAFFSGCLMDTMFMKTNDATLTLLNKVGCEIVVPETQGCCGALHGHSGELNQAKEMAKRNIIAFEEENIDFIITNAGGCGAFLHDYGELFNNDPDWHDRAKRFANKIKDVSQVLVELVLSQFELSLPKQRVTYQDSCHLKNVQDTYKAPRALIKAIEGIEYVEMNQASSCCGSAGIYNILEPEMSQKILQTKMDHMKDTKATTIVTANPGCLLQMKLGVEQEGLSQTVRVVHIADLLHEALEHKNRS